MSPLDLSALLARTARVSVTYAQETFWVDYLPHALTVEVQGRLAAVRADDAQAAVRSLLELIPLLVADWEIEQDGEPVPVGAQTLERFPLGLLGAIATAITEDIAAGGTLTTEAAAETPSSSGASRPARLALAPTGTG